MSDDRQALDHSEEAQPRKGRSNAILTYQLMATFDKKLTELLVRFESFVSDRKHSEKGHDDHESRIRFLEVELNTMKSADKATSGSWHGIAIITGIILQSIGLVAIFVKHIVP